jgi:hypothetical protein
MGSALVGLKTKITKPMTTFLESLISLLWNRAVARGDRSRPGSGIDLGNIVADDQITPVHFFISFIKLLEHITIRGKTGVGKSTLLIHCLCQLIDRQLGLLLFDFHGDLGNSILAYLARTTGQSLEQISKRLIIIDPSDLTHAVGINLLELRPGLQAYVQIAEFAQILKQRWGLDSLGARTEELLRNSLYALARAGMTIVEISHFLTNVSFRAACLQLVDNEEVKAFFTEHYDRLSEGYRSTILNAVTNKVSSFISDPHYRHILGQQLSTFSLLDAIDTGCLIILRLNKGLLGEQALTFGALFLSLVKHLAFARKGPDIFALVLDEVQNLMTQETGLETLLSEARKKHLSVWTANQYGEQLPNTMQAALSSVGTQMAFQSASADAERSATAYGGGKHLAELLRNLPPRHLVVKSGHNHWQQVVVPTVKIEAADYSHLIEESRRRFALPRTEIEQQIQQRRLLGGAPAASGGLHGWE